MLCNYDTSPNKRLPLEPSVSSANTAHARLCPPCFLQSGEQGLTNINISERVGMRARLLTNRLVDLVKRFGLQLRVENYGRQIHNRLFAPPEMRMAAGVIPGLQTQQQQQVNRGTAANGHI